MKKDNMKKDSDKDTLAASWPALKAQHDEFVRGGGMLPEAPTRLKPCAIRRWPGVFQHRQYVGGTHSRAHVDALIKGALTHDLAPLVVWWDGLGWACIDGHHRLMAYHYVEKDDKEVPVVAFQGTLAEAMAEAARLNAPDKLAMSQSEKSNAAWRLVLVADELSKEQTALAACVSASLVAMMRKYKKKLTAEVQRWEDTDPLDWVGPRPVELTSLSWPEAKALAEGEDREGLADPDEREERAQGIARILAMELGPMLKYPDIMARALELVHPRLPGWLMEEWGEEYGEVD